jgi:3-hydroxyacyl-CoA dehydrogenase
MCASAARWRACWRAARVRAHDVSEQDVLDLEREAFLSLLGTKETQQRIEAMLKTGKPLRN